MLVPVRRNPDFVGRKSQLEELDARLSSDEVCQRVAVVGLGGVGKTQLVLEYAYRRREKSPDCSIFWVPANNVTNFEREYLKIGKKLEIPGIIEKGANVKELVQEWLSKESTGPWLLIIDNADDFEMLTKREDDDTGSLRLIDYLPTSRNGSIIFTSRDRNAAGNLTSNNIIDVDEMDQREAKEVFLKTSKKPHLGEDADIPRLLKLLAHLPLAIVQAAAYISKDGCLISEYIELYEESEMDTIDLLGQDFGDEYRDRYTDMKNPVATTWFVSFRQICQKDRLAAEYLSFMACLHYENIPKSLLPAEKSKIKARNAIGTLKGYSFITERERDKFFDLHRLVHLATRNWMREEKEISSWHISFWADKALERLAELMPAGDPEERPTWIAYLPHAQCVLDSTDLSGKRMIEKATLLDSVGCCLQTNGQYKQALQRHKKALEIREKLLGQEGPDTLTSMDEVALALSCLGEYAKAEEMSRRALALTEKVLGKDDKDTMTSMSKLASLLVRMGKYEEARLAHQEVLERRQEILGKKHRDTLTSMTHLASALNSQGRYDESERMHRETLELRKEVSGQDHQDTLTTMSLLASVLSNRGKYSEAEDMHGRILELRKKKLPQEHPDILMTMSKLASVLYSQGKYAAAEQMHRETLELREKVLGEEHPSTLMSKSHLASALNKLGQYDKAMEDHQRTLKLRKKLGLEHPHTFMSMDELGLVFSNQGKYDEAEQMHQQALEGFKRILGNEHPDTLLCANNLVLLYVRRGKWKEAEHLGKEVVEIMKRVLGEAHPHTKTSIETLKSVYRNQENCKEPKELGLPGTTARKRGFDEIIDEEHPDLLDGGGKRAKKLELEAAEV
jgi:tetratricopeptide (TPR) repeat protein